VSRKSQRRPLPSALSGKRRFGYDCRASRNLDSDEGRCCIFAPNAAAPDFKMISPGIEVDVRVDEKKARVGHCKHRYGRICIGGDGRPPEHRQEIERPENFVDDRSIESSITSTTWSAGGVFSDFNAASRG
jgi:hypothetical protein